jgi:hypothetical protein
MNLQNLYRFCRNNCCNEVCIISFLITIFTVCSVTLQRFWSKNRVKLKENKDCDGAENVQQNKYKIPQFSDVIYAESKMQNKKLTKQPAWIFLVCYSCNFYPLMYLIISLLSGWRELCLAVDKIWNTGESDDKIYAEYVRRIRESKGK